MFCMALEKAAVSIDNYYLRKEVLDVYNGKTGRFNLDYQRFSDSLCKSIDAAFSSAIQNIEYVDTL